MPSNQVLAFAVLAGLGALVVVIISRIIYEIITRLRDRAKIDRIIDRNNMLRYLPQVSLEQLAEIVKKLGWIKLEDGPLGTVWSIHLPSPDFADLDLIAKTFGSIIRHWKEIQVRIAGLGGTLDALEEGADEKFPPFGMAELANGLLEYPGTKIRKFTETLKASEFADFGEKLEEILASKQRELEAKDAEKYRQEKIRQGLRAAGVKVE